MIQVNGLTKSYGSQMIFDDAGFSAQAGERIGLVGRNGSGKTTLFRILTGEEQPDTGVISAPAGYRIGHLSQHLRFTEPTVLEEGCRGLPRSEDAGDESYKVERILMGLGFAAVDFAMDPRELSGGFQVRLNLGKLLASDPDLLLLDEPTNYLDILSIRWLGTFLRSWKKELIFITHDRAFMDSVTTHTLGIHRRRLRKIDGPTDKLTAQILLEEEVHEQTRINEEKRRREIEQFINRFRAQATRARAVQSKIKALRKRERLERLTDEKDLDFVFPAAPFTGKVLADVNDLSFSYQAGGPRIISGLDLRIGKRDRIAVIGTNGRGKTTLLNLLAGELQPAAGSILYHEQAKRAFFGQTNIERLDPDKTVEDEITDADPEQSRNRARSVCGLMLFEGDTALKKVRVLSGGEKSRVLLGRLIVSPANLLLLDEPTNHLDMESVDSLLAAIDVFEGAVVIVTHSEMILHAVAARLVVFKGEGAEVFEGTYEDFLEQRGWGDDGADLQRERRPADVGEPRKTGAAERRETKRLKAELIQRRSQTLGRLQARITEVEGEIIEREHAVSRDTEGLVRASMQGEAETIRRLSKAVHDAQARIETLFAELDLLTQEYDTKSREFAEQLGELETARSPG